MKSFKQIVYGEETSHLFEISYKKNQFKTIAKKMTKMKPGSSMNFRINLKEELFAEAKKPVRYAKSSESSSEQKQRKGGEVSEVSMMRELYILLSKKTDVNLLDDSGKKVSLQKWTKDVYNKVINSFKSAEKSPQKLNRWIGNGTAAANNFYDDTVKEYGSVEALRLLKFTLKHMGIAGQGSTKSDIDINVIEKSSNEIAHEMKISMKSTEGALGSYKGSGLQTGYETFFMSLISGKYSRELDYYNSNSREDIGNELEKITKEYNQSVENINRIFKSLNDEDYFDKVLSGTDAETRDDMEQFYDPDSLEEKRKYLDGLLNKEGKKFQKLGKQMSQLQDKWDRTPEHDLDELAVKYNIKTPKGVSLGKYIKDLTTEMKSFEKWAYDPSQNKDFVKSHVLTNLPDSLSKPFHQNQTRYIDILEELTRKALKDDKVKEQMIKGTLSLAGMESGLDYISTGGRAGSSDENKEFLRVAASTLYNSGYKKPISLYQV
jgi:hypothetical protein